jgi:hypothetical protein
MHTHFSRFFNRYLITLFITCPFTFKFQLFTNMKTPCLILCYVSIRKLTTVTNGKKGHFLIENDYPMPDLEAWLILW